MLASRVLSDRVGSRVEVVDSAIEPNDASSKFVQLQVRQATLGGKGMELGKNHRCQEDLGADSPLAYVVFKREGREWVSKGAVVCSMQSAPAK